MKRIALLNQCGRSKWASCQPITSQLVAAYRLAFPDDEIRPFELALDATRYESYREAERIAEFGPELLAFTDHAPHPGALVRALTELLSPEKMPRLVFHVFGDFAIHPNEWIDLSESLAKADVRFVCASQKQATLIRSFVETSSNGVQWIPFPVDTLAHRYLPARQAEVRRAHECAERDFVFLYAGRLSLQKNILLLLKAFSIFTQQINPNASLWLAGPIDDMGIPYLGKAPPAGLFSYDLQTLLASKSMSPESRRIRYFGNLGREALSDLYQAADCYVSLSAHNDEDFGLAPAEAACTGLPLVLTDWAGFSSFRELLPDGTDLIPLEIGAKSIAPSAGDCVKALTRASEARWSQGRRETQMREASEKFSCAAIANKIREMLDDSSRARFTRFTPLFSQVAQAFGLNPQAPFKSGQTYSELYRKVYGAYV